MRLTDAAKAGIGGFVGRGFGIAAAALLMLALAGCERREKILEIETPESEIEIYRSDDNGGVEIRREDDGRD